MKTIEIFQQSILPAHIHDLINSVPADLPKKIDHVANVIHALQVEAKKLKSQEMELSHQRKALEFVVEQAESSIKEELRNEDRVEMTGELIKFTIHDSPPKLIIEDESLIPEVYKTEVIKKELRKDAIKDELRMGNEIPGAKLETGITLKTLVNKG